VWQALGGADRFLYYCSDAESLSWIVSDEESMEAADDAGIMTVVSTAATPDQITEVWEVVENKVSSMRLE
jgi:hypothetical protein